MEFNEVVKSRRSIRKYKPDPLPDEYLQQIIEAARLAPSGLNIQPWRYIIVKDRSICEKIAAATPSTFIAGAPVIIICCVEKNAMNSMRARAIELIRVGAIPAPREYADHLENTKMDEVLIKTNLYMNAAISIGNILLQAADLGLGTCWIGLFDAQAVKELAGIDNNYDIPALVAVGYPDQDPAPRPRLPVSEILLKII